MESNTAIKLLGWCWFCGLAAILALATVFGMAGVLTIGALAGVLALAAVLGVTGVFAIGALAGVFAFAAIFALAAIFAFAGVLGFFASRSSATGFGSHGFDSEGTGIKAGNSGGHEDCTGGFIHLDFVVLVSFIHLNKHHARRV